MAGEWTGECVASDDACLIGTLCLPSQATLPTCQTACSTEGHRIPHGKSGPDLNNGGGGGNPHEGPLDGSVIPDLMPVGGSWVSRDGCELTGGFKECACEMNSSVGRPSVDCDLRCRDDG